MRFTLILVSRDSVRNLHHSHTLYINLLLGFISTLIAEEPVYSESILPRLCPPSQEVFLDFGCCFGPVIRRLIADGADPKNLHGADLHADYIAFGHELFQDGPESANPLVSQFHTGDVFDETFLTELKDGVDIIHITSFLHLFSWDKQVQALTHLEQLLRKKKGSLVVGAHIGTVEGGELVIPSRPKLTAAKIFRHNTATFRKLWSQIGDGNWEVDVREEMLPSLDHGDCPLLQPDESGQCLRLHFAVTRA